MIKCAEEGVALGRSSGNLLEIDLVVFAVAEVYVLNRKTLNLRIILAVHQHDFGVIGFLNQL